jgi:hypothetical protein
MINKHMVWEVGAGGELLHVAMHADFDEMERDFIGRVQGYGVDPDTDVMTAGRFVAQEGTEVRMQMEVDLQVDYSPLVVPPEVRMIVVYDRDSRAYGLDRHGKLVPALLDFKADGSVVGDVPPERIIKDWYPFEHPDERPAWVKRSLGPFTAYVLTPPEGMGLSTPAAAKAAGFKVFNGRSHLLVDVPDGLFTISCRTSAGDLVTFAFCPYRKGAAAACVDVHVGDRLAEFPCHGDHQRLIAFGHFNEKPDIRVEDKDECGLVTHILPKGEECEVEK